MRCIVDVELTVRLYWETLILFSEIEELGFWFLGIFRGICVFG